MHKKVARTFSVQLYCTIFSSGSQEAMNWSYLSDEMAQTKTTTWYYLGDVYNSLLIIIITHFNC